MTTKEQICLAALDLFAKKGYAAASVRDVAAQVGIKDSSLYYHYANKQAILDSVTERFIETSNGMMAMMDTAVQGLSVMDDDQFIGVTRQYLHAYFLDDFVSKFIAVMNHEQSHNAALRQLYIEWCIDRPTEFQARLFKKLQEIGYLKKLETRQMVISYYAPILLFFGKCIGFECTPDDRDAFVASVLESTAHFLEIYREKAI